MRIRVQGHVPLNGVYKPSGNANAAQAMLAASLLTDAPVTLHNIPRNLSTNAMLEAAEMLGASLTWGDDELSVTVQSVMPTRRVLTHKETDASIGGLLFVP